MSNIFLPLLKRSSFLRINHYIHAYNIPGLHDVLFPFKETIVTKYKREINDTTSFNILLNNELEDFERQLNEFNFQLVKKYYDISSERFSYANMGAYVQDHTEDKYVLHNHMGSNGLGMMVSTMYIDPVETPEEGGGLLIHFPEKIQNMEIGVLKDWVYIIPSYVGHRPTKQTREKHRVCLNWTLDGRKKPLQLLSGDIW